MLVNTEDRHFIGVRGGSSDKASIDLHAMQQICL